MIRETIGDKKIYITTYHQYVLPCWLEIRNVVGQPLTLLTFDHHTDAQLAFTRHLRMYGKLPPKPLDAMAAATEACAEIDQSKLDEVLKACDRLQNSEHIDAAIRMGIIQQAFIVSCEAEVAFGPERNIFHIPSHKGGNNGEDPRSHYDKLLESDFLARIQEALTTEAGEHRVNDLSRGPFVLDVDLDFFHTRRSIEPRNTDVFYQLIRSAAGITIATEPSYVESEQLSGENLDSEFLLEKIKEHIAKAVDSRVARTD